MKRSKHQSTSRRHTDGGEHALSIDLARYEYSAKIIAPPSNYQGPNLIENSKSKPGIFNRIFRNKSFRHNLNNSSEPILSHKSILDVPSFSDENFSPQNPQTHQFFISLLYQNQFVEVHIPSFPTFKWLYASFSSSFNLNCSSNDSRTFCYLLKLPNSTFFESLLLLEQLVEGSIVSIYLNRKYDINSEGEKVSSNHLHFPTSDRFFNALSPRESIVEFSKRLGKLRNDLNSLKWTTLTFHEEYRILVRDNSEHIKHLLKNVLHQGTISQNEVPHFRFERINIHSMEMDYFANSFDVYTELELLERSIENIRLDVSQRRCRILPEEVEFLNTSVSNIGAALLFLRKRFLDLEPTLKRIMALELEVIVREEEFVKNEEFHLDESILKCRQLNSTLIALRKLCNIQHSRETIILDMNVNPYLTPEMWHSLMDQIRTTNIDHAARLRSIEISNLISKRKFSLNIDPMKAFTLDLQGQRKILRKTNNISVITNRNNLNFHKWLEEYKRERFLQGSHQKLSVFNNNSNIQIFQTDENKFNNSFLNRRVDTIQQIDGSYIHPQVSQKRTCLDNLLSSGHNFNIQAATNIQSFNTHSNYFQKNVQYPGPYLLSVPGPTQRSTNSEKYLIRPQEVHNIKDPSKLQNPFHKFSVV